jgi:succinate dehydrogenase / fumarate reductase cytochrome b subunit
MTWITKFLSSTLGKKLLMALTGLFLISFLAVHLIGNLQLLHDDNGKAFNIYAEFMSTNPIVQTISKVNFALILIHIIWGFWLTRMNRAARGEVGYSVTNKSSTWTSRNMGILGTLILIFIVIHLRHFYGEMHYGGIATVNYDGEEYRDIYTVVAFWFGKGWYVGLYVFCMVALGFHLWHGFASIFQTLGLNHVKYNGLIKFVGRAFAIVVPAGFAWIPIAMFFY